MNKAAIISPRQTARNMFFTEYQRKDYSALVERIRHARAWEEGNHAANAELDVILGLTLRHLGKEAEALVLLLKVVKSQHASNADKIAANACLSIRFMEHGDDFALEAAMHELECLTPSPATSLWAAKALGDLSESFARRKDFENAKTICSYAIDACEGLKRSDDEYLRTEGKEIMSDITCAYASLVLIPQNKLKQAEKYLARGVEGYRVSGHKLKAVECYAHLSRIASAEKRKEEAVLFEEKAWDILKVYRDKEPFNFLDAGVLLLLLAKDAGWDEDGYLRELFERHGFENPEKELEAVHERRIQTRRDDSN